MKKIVMIANILLVVTVNAQERTRSGPDVHLAESPDVCIPSFPYNEDWETISDFNCWNSSGEGDDKWMFCNTLNLDGEPGTDNVVAIFPSEALPKNHWLVSSPLDFEAGMSYKIDITYNALHSSFGPAKESLSVGILDGLNPYDAVVALLGQIHGITQTGSFTGPFNKDMASVASYTYTPEISYTGYLGLRAGGAPQTGILLIYQVNIEALTLQRPAFKSASTAIYPNPANDIVTIASENNPVFLIEIFDAQGRAVSRIQYDNEDTVTCDISGLAAGIYSIHLKCLSGDFIKKLVKK